MKIETGIKLHNRFDIEVIRDGQVIQRGEAENIVLDRMYTRICSFRSFFNRIHFGTGSGTPTASRTTLFTELDYKTADIEEVTMDIPDSKVTRKIRLEPEEYVGQTITEVGISESNTEINTHAMIKDSEGNPLSITKTALDVVMIYATVYFTFSSSAGVSYGGVGLENNWLSTWMQGNSTLSGFISYLRALACSGDAVALGQAEYTYPDGETSDDEEIADLVNKKTTFGPFRFAVDNANDNGINVFYLLPYYGTYGLFAKVDVNAAGFGPYQITDDPLTGDVDDVNKKFITTWGGIIDGTLTLKADGVTINSADYTVDYDHWANLRNMASGWTLIERTVTEGASPIYNSPCPFNKTSSTIRVDGRQQLTFEVDDILRTHGMASFFCHIKDSYADLKVYAKRQGGIEFEEIIYINTGYGSASNLTYTLPTTIDWSDIEYLKFDYTNEDDGFSFGDITPKVALQDYLIEFITAPAAGTVLTADYQTKAIPKDENHVVDVEFIYQFGEGA